MTTTFGRSAADAGQKQLLHTTAMPANRFTVVFDTGAAFKDLVRGATGPIVFEYRRRKIVRETIGWQNHGVTEDTESSFDAVKILRVLRDTVVYFFARQFLIPIVFLLCPTGFKRATFYESMS